MLEVELADIDRDIENGIVDEIIEVRKRALLSLSKKWYTRREAKVKVENS